MTNVRLNFKAVVKMFKWVITNVLRQIKKCQQGHETYRKEPIEMLKQKYSKIEIKSIWGI